MANVRPQLLFYGKSPNGTASYDRYLTRDQVLQWIHGIMSQFDLMMVLEYFDYSLALISLQFCIPPEDLLYIAVNQRHDHSEKPQFKDENLVRLKELNWPDFLYYQAVNTTFWRKVEMFGEDNVREVAETIQNKSQALSSECIDFENTGRDKMVDRVLLLEEKKANATCLKLQFQGVRATKLFMGLILHKKVRIFKHLSAHQIEELMEESHRSYKFCGNKLVYGEPAASYQAWKHNYLDGYNALLDD